MASPTPLLPKQYSDIVVSDLLTHRPPSPTFTRFVGFFRRRSREFAFYNSDPISHILPFLILSIFIFHFRAICYYGFCVCILFSYGPYAVWSYVT